jgi:hypothetical protein
MDRPRPFLNLSPATYRQFRELADQENQNISSFLTGLILRGYQAKYPAPVPEKL